MPPSLIVAVEHCLVGDENCAAVDLELSFRAVDIGHRAVKGAARVKHQVKRLVRATEHPEEQVIEHEIGFYRTDSRRTVLPKGPEQGDASRLEATATQPSQLRDRVFELAPDHAPLALLASSRHPQA